MKTPVRNSAGRVIGLQAVFWDVSEQKLSVLVLQQAKETAETANRAKCDFLGNMSNETQKALPNARISHESL